MRQAPLRDKPPLEAPPLYSVIPVFVFLAYIGFLPPFALAQATKPRQEQSVPADKKSGPDAT